MTEKQRNELRPIIEEQALSYAVVHLSPQRIDQINILNASIEAMQKALDKLTFTPEFIVVDGNRFKPYKEIPYSCQVKGDARFIRIAAASVLAKTYRDAYMEELHKEFPMYHWDKNKGYPTREHRAAILEFGACEHHRKTFQLIDIQLKFDF